jgi:hypothetical protein
MTTATRSRSRTHLAARATPRSRTPWVVKDANRGASQGGSPTALQDPKDDGSVPDKHLSRWHNEGGSLGPAD